MADQLDMKKLSISNNNQNVSPGNTTTNGNNFGGAGDSGAASSDARKASTASYIPPHARSSISTTNGNTPATNGAGPSPLSYNNNNADFAPQQQRQSMYVFIQKVCFVYLLIIY